MKKSFIKDNQGIAHIALILGLVVILAIGGVGYYVYNKNKETKVSPSSSSTSVADTESEKVCNRLYKDKDLCKFASHYSSTSPYKATMANTDKDGKSSTILIESDGKDNTSMISKDGNTEVSAFISLDGDTYMKDEADGSWTKYPKSPDAPKTVQPTDDLKIDAKEESKPEAERVAYKKLGKEKVGGVNCFKYQVTDPSQPGTESTVWFGDKDFQLHKWSFKDKDGALSVAEFSFGTVTIKAPSPVKTAPAAPSEAEIQKILNQTQ